MLVEVQEGELEGGEGDWHPCRSLKRELESGCRIRAELDGTEVTITAISDTAFDSYSCAVSTCRAHDKVNAHAVDNAN